MDCMLMSLPLMMLLQIWYVLLNLGNRKAHFLTTQFIMGLICANILMQKAFLDTILSENPGLPCFCFAHSTGAAIVLKVGVLVQDTNFRLFLLYYSPK